MKAYIIAAYENFSFAERLLEDIRNIRILSTPVENEAGNTIKSTVQKKINIADVVLVIIDKKFLENLKLNEELAFALTKARKKIIPIVLDKATVPTALQGSLYISCSKNGEDLKQAKVKIQSFLEHRRYNVQTRSQSKTSSMIILTIAIEMFAMLFVVLIFKEQSLGMAFRNESILTITIGLCSVMLAFVALLTSYLSIMKRRWQEDNEEEIDSYSRRLQKAIASEKSQIEVSLNVKSEDNKKEIDALGRMMINLEDIKEFYTWSQKQAKASFVLAVAMCISGFILMMVAVLLPVVFRLDFEMSIIPAIGGVITELVAGTALVVYKHSLLQLNHYHKALHEDERFLSSVNLLGKFSSVEAQDEMLREIIRSEIEMNTAGLKNTGDIKKEKNIENVK